MADAGESVNKDMKVFVVDSQVLPPQVSVRRDGPQLSVIYLLLAVALLGVFIEAGFIWHLYSRTAASSDIQKVEYIKGEKHTFPSSSHDSNEILPAKPPKAESKPAAFLQIASPPFSGNGVLHWRADSFPVFMRGLEYKDNSLYVQQDGYYYIFSKISHMENCNFFKHQVMQCTERYNFKAIELMQSSRFICVTNLSQSRGNSYLGGIFHLFKGDSVFVKVSNSSQVHGEAYENFFGAFMV
ncbi:tumor necrosis factor ligand superfamily member 14-like isoform X1 [Cyprinus carpio]|uniref:Tumor necrosis factor ligand superfamily member 14-like isoform X1 n=1 Tax=Cyprinus carpio TaxID=7962 RepID=A0A9R0B492_CYPCA|nr:tumor necrosis factor ligand superfamily member 14-like isoform X1 [Cyprinus carpio]XP_042621555.1 tumor necrosis factor ligand superfamily member 14-like isoform X1 [Cyprinus carpio]